MKSFLFNFGFRNSKDDAFYGRLLDIVSHDFNQGSVTESCHELMALTAEGYGPDCTSVLLWLGDSAQDDPELRLVGVHPKNKETGRLDNLLNISSPWDEKTFPVLTEETEQRISAWYEGNHGYKYKASSELKLVSTTKDGCHCLGYLQLLVKTDKNQSSPRSDAVAKAMGARIYAGRNIRLLEAIQNLHLNLVGVDDPQQILEKAAIEIRKFIRARMCVIYRPIGSIKGRQLKVVAIAADEDASTRLPPDINCFPPTSDTLTAHIFDQGCNVRIKDINDTNEINKLFPSHKCEIGAELLAKFDNILDPSHERAGAAHSRIFVPIRVKALGGGEITIALIEVLGKFGNLYLHDQFSSAEEEILKRAARYLASILPEIEIMASMRDISAALVNVPLDEPGKQVQISIAETLLGSLKKCVNGIEAVSFVFDNLSSVPIHTVPENWANDLGSCVATEVGTIKEIPSNKSRWRYATSPNGKADRTSGWLLVGLTTDKLPKYQAEIIKYTATEVWLTAYELAAYDQAIKYLIEVRHAIRSGVQGVIGHIDNALDTYYLVAECDDLKVTQRELISSASFRKSLEAGLLSAQHTQMLLEQARLHYSGIQHVSLEISEHNLPALLSDTIRITRPDTEQRKLLVNYNNDIPNDMEKAAFDHKAICIVMYNLLDNAIKYAARDTTIIIRTWIEGQFWFVAIENEGVYIAPDDYETIFQPFIRVFTHDFSARDGISTRPGTGLGLAISRKIITAHSKDACLLVNSIQSGGASMRARTMFTIKMPRYPVKE